MDVEFLARLQFAFTIAFHYIYPPLSIGLGVMLVLLEGAYLRTSDKDYEQLTRFWIRIFALIFGIGVATGIVMEFEFGTNWATYSPYVGDIFGSALAAEGIFAFALESGFLGILIFGWNRVSPRVHFGVECSCLVPDEGTFRGHVAQSLPPRFAAGDGSGLCATVQRSPVGPISRGISARQTRCLRRALRQPCRGGLVLVRHGE